MRFCTIRSSTYQFERSTLRVVICSCAQQSQPQLLWPFLILRGRDDSMHYQRKVHRCVNLYAIKGNAQPPSYTGWLRSGASRYLCHHACITKCRGKIIDAPIWNSPAARRIPAIMFLNANIFLQRNCIVQTLVTSRLLIIKHFCPHKRMPWPHAPLVPA